MSPRPRRNILVMQSGGPTPVMNRSLFGVVSEAEKAGHFGQIYGADHGLEGALSGMLIELGHQSATAWSRLARTPGAALGSSRRRLKADDVPVILDVLAKHSIGYLFIIGGNDSAETGHRISLEAAGSGGPLTVITVPKTIDNDLVMTDHSPGYGSAARFVAMATMGAGRDAEAMANDSPIAIIEVMGRDSGWVAAAAAIGRQEDRDAPHVICVPEVPLDEQGFLSRVEEAYRRYGFAVAVVAENTRGPDGVLGGQEEPWLVDDFGHPYFDGPGRYLAGLVGRQLKVRARYEKPGTIQRSLVACVSRTDAGEAEMVGRMAVIYALEGHGDKMVTLVREPRDTYACTTALAPLEDVAGRVHAMPDEYLDPSTNFVTARFLDYLRPLIGGPLPQFGRLG